MSWIIGNKKIYCNNKLISSKAKTIKSKFRLGTGLMFSKKRNDFALIFEFDKDVKYDITMFFVFYKIDIIFLDKNNKIIETIKNLKPFSNYSVKNKYSKFIEMPSGFIKKFNIRIGDNIFLT
jgi:uncharacterized membrane protein (UPF0127 family)